MAINEIRFDDGAAYERYMGKWSQLAGDTSSTGLRHNPVCDGSTWAAATAP
jgi:hypothetical protein